MRKRRHRKVKWLAQVGKRTQKSWLREQNQFREYSAISNPYFLYQTLLKWTILTHCSSQLTSFKFPVVFFFFLSWKKKTYTVQKSLRYSHEPHYTDREKGRKCSRRSQANGKPGIGHRSPEFQTPCCSHQSALPQTKLLMYMLHTWGKRVWLTFFVSVGAGLVLGLSVGFSGAEGFWEYLLQALGFDGSPNDLQNSTWKETPTRRPLITGPMFYYFSCI